MAMAKRRPKRPKRQDPASVRLALRPAAAADALDTSRSQVYELMATGLLPSVRIGGMRLIRIAAIEQLLRRGTV
jgi:excisionase family DNA binding protein